MRFILPIIGTLLICLLFADIFFTIFHAAGRGGPINRRQNVLAWHLFRSLGIRRDGTNRPVVLAAGGPAIVAATLVVWLTWLVLGFFLIYLPFVGSFLYSPGAMRIAWAEALYFSVTTAATLGTGDLVPDDGWLRLLSAVQGMCGFALFSLSITYLLCVYGELITSRATASKIAGYFDDGPQAVADHLAELGAEPFARWSDEVSTALLTHVQSQFQYPVIKYFYATDTSRALPVQLRTLVAFDGHVRDSDDPEMRRLSGHPSYLALRRAVLKLIDESERHFVPRSFSGRSAIHGP
jgi:hypothetical protein